MTSLMTWLLKTKALDIAPPDRPYWYASGTFGPFFINTHYLFGDEKSAKAFLSQIEKALEEPETSTEQLLPIVRSQQATGEGAYCTVINLALKAIESLADKIDFVSGGERRDLFFSLAIADALNKPHLTILKDGRCYWYDATEQSQAQVNNHHKVQVLGKNQRDESSQIICQDRWLDPESLPLRGLRGLHVADLITEASSFFRNWIPSVEKLGATMTHAFAIVDRGQGGDRRLAESNIPLTSLVVTDESFFALAVESGAISEAQADQSIRFLQNPKSYMDLFLESHEDFIEKELATGGKSAERAALFVANRAKNQ